MPNERKRPGAGDAATLRVHRHDRSLKIEGAGFLRRAGLILPSPIAGRVHNDGSTTRLTENAWTRSSPCSPQPRPPPAGATATPKRAPGVGKGSSLCPREK